jgi:hypothetical protein
MRTKSKTAVDGTAATDSQPPVFRDNADLREATERAVEQCDTPTVARVVGRLSKMVGSQYRMETYVDAAKAVLGDDAPVTAAEAGRGETQ